MSDEDDLLIADDNLNYKSIFCQNIPDAFLDKTTAKKHFSKFGKINRFILRPKRLQCTVEYEREDDAESAFVNAGNYNGINFDIKFTKNEVTPSKNIEEWVDSEVQSELDSMGHAGRLQTRANVLRNMSPRYPKSILKPGKSLDAVPRVVDSVARGELESILKKPAFDAEERYLILDARDKLIRLTTFRTTDIKKAVSTKGVCPDMCPEKERLMREAKRQVSLFEIQDDDQNSMDPRIAIKEYSRSSADQEAPLAHELRPEPVLKMTMTYLLHKVMDLCDDLEVNLGDWYHFLWDRTRSLRKDITQQELCSLGAVELVEQCARFHIHCAARLIAEEPSVFDQKINTENLTKCLQTLKYMYHDLRLKGVKCPNEPEFRAYVVLLNLSDSNFLWEIKQLPPEIQNSTEIRFALSTYLAMENNNYVRFFKLVQKTTYLNACILLRYFTQLRLKAIMTILKAYIWPRQVASMPLNYLRDILALDSEEAAINLFNFYGLDCDSEKVFFDKKSFFLPEIPFVMERSLHVVEAKRQVSVGEVVCGHKLDSLDEFENHIPHNSFDEDGYLRPEAWNAEDQLPEAVRAPRTPTPDRENSLFKMPRPSPPPLPKQPNKSLFQFSSAQESASSVSSIFEHQSQNNVFMKPKTSPSANFGSIFTSQRAPEARVVEETPTPSTFSISTPTPLSLFGTTGKTENTEKGFLFGNSLSSSETTGKSIFSGGTFFKPLTTSSGFEKPPIFGIPSVSSPTTAPLIRDDPLMDTVDHENEKIKLMEKMEKEKREKIEEEKRVAREKDKLQQEEEQRKREAEEKKEKIKKIIKQSNVVLEEVLSAALCEEIPTIAKAEVNYYKKLLSASEQLTQEVVDELILDTLYDIVEEEEAIILGKHEKLQRKYYEKWRKTVTLRKQRRKLIESIPTWFMKDSVENHVSNLEAPCQDDTLKMMTRYRLGVPNTFNLHPQLGKPIDVLALVARELNKKIPTYHRGLRKSMKYLKIVLSIPDENEEIRGFNSYLNNWLEKNIIRGKASNSKSFVNECRGNLCLCIRKISGFALNNEQNEKVTTECDHADAILFTMTYGDLLDSRKRLHHLLKVSILKSVPLAIVVYNSSHRNDFVRAELHIDELLSSGQISSCTILGSYDRVRDEGMRNAFENAFKFLAKEYDETCEVEMQLLTSLMHITLGKEFWHKLHDTWKINPSFRKFCTKPRNVVQLYNEAIERVIKLVDADLSTFPDFPLELKEFVPQMQSDIPVTVESFPPDWKNNDKRSKIKAFLSKLKLEYFGEESLDITTLQMYLLKYAEMCIPGDKNISKKAGYSAMETFTQKVDDPLITDLTVVQKMNFISWLNILKHIALWKLSFTWNLEMQNLPKDVVYIKSSLEDYINKPWWLDNERVKAIKVRPAVDEADKTLLDGPPVKKPKLFSPDNLEEILAKGSALVEKAQSNIERIREHTNISQEVTRTFDAALYSQEMAERNLKLFLRDNL